MLTPLWEAGSPAGVPAGVEERIGTRGVARNGISFPSAEVRKVDSLSEDLQGWKNNQHQDFTQTGEVTFVYASKKTTSAIRTT